MPSFDALLTSFTSSLSKVVFVLKLGFNDGYGNELKEDDGDHDDGKGLHARLITEDGPIEEGVAMVMMVTVTTSGAEGCHLVVEGGSGFKPLIKFFYTNNVTKLKVVKY